MLVRKEKYYVKKVNRTRYCYDKKYIKKVTYKLFGIIPLYISYKIADQKFDF